MLGGQSLDRNPPLSTRCTDKTKSASKEYTGRARIFFDGLPRKLMWSGLAAAVVMLTGVVAALTSSGEPEQKSSSVVAAPPVASLTSVAAAPAPVAEMVISSEALELEAQIDVLSKSQNKKERRAAARWLQRPPADVEVPPFATAIARLELGSDCRVQSAALQRLRTLGDARALPAISYWNGLPVTGCGVFEKRDCYACIRDDLRTTQRVLRRNSQQAVGPVASP